VQSTGGRIIFDARFSVVVGLRGHHPLGNNGCLGSSHRAPSRGGHRKLSCANLLQTMARSVTMPIRELAGLRRLTVAARNGPQRSSGIGSAAARAPIFSTIQVCPKDRLTFPRQAADVANRLRQGPRAGI
jgi:hypothetical protein